MTAVLKFNVPVSSLAAHQDKPIPYTGPLTAIRRTKVPPALKDKEVVPINGAVAFRMDGPPQATTAGVYTASALMVDGVRGSIEADVKIWNLETQRPNMLDAYDTTWVARNVYISGEVPSDLPTNTQIHKCTYGRSSARVSQWLSALL
jgi:hypothetical protein